MRTVLKWEGGTVTGDWHGLDNNAVAALVLGHGAGHNLDTKLLIDVATGLRERRIAVLRFNFPYTEAGRRAPDKQPVLEACFGAVAEQAAEETRLPVWLGGKSMGGRIASHAVSNGFDAAGLIFLGYPLHPPGKPERIRDAHLGAIKVPMLWLQGTRDSFATPELLHKTVGSLPTATLIEISGGDHSFKVSGRKPHEVTDELITHIVEFMGAPKPKRAHGEGATE
jgi:uncharacterized protein